MYAQAPEPANNTIASTQVAACNGNEAEAPGDQGRWHASLRCCRICKQIAYAGKSICLNRDCKLHKATFKRKKQNKGLKRQMWFAEQRSHKTTRSSLEEDDEDDEDEDESKPAFPIGKDWWDWGDWSNEDSYRQKSRGHWQWAWVQ